MRVLLVEDDKDLSRQLRTALGDAGYAVDHAPDGEEAQFLGETEPYDAVILDLGLPKVDGVSVPLDPQEQRRPDRHGHRPRRHPRRRGRPRGGRRRLPDQAVPH
jgi:DNA-binding response OmpR family regulator